MSMLDYKERGMQRTVIRIKGKKLTIEVSFKVETNLIFMSLVFALMLVPLELVLRIDPLLLPLFSPSVSGTVTFSLTLIYKAKDA